MAAHKSKNIFNPALVAVRSSATAEDSSSAAWAGQLDSFLNTTESDLREKVQRCWASLFTPRAIFYRFEKEFYKTKISVAVVVQKMVDSDKSGVIFSKDPTNKNDSVIIEAVFGLGEGIVSGSITPDTYIVSENLDILDKKISDKKIAVTRNSQGETEIVKLKDEAGVEKTEVTIVLRADSKIKTIKVNKAGRINIVD